MRYDKRYTRVLGIITDPVIPRSADGRLMLCHHHQRMAAFAGGFIEYLTKALRHAAMKATVPKGECPHCGHGDVHRFASRNRMNCKACGKQFSETSGTLHRSPKMDPTVRERLMVELRRGGRSVLSIAKEFGIQSKTVYRLKRIADETATD